MGAICTRDSSMHAFMAWYFICLSVYIFLNYMDKSIGTESILMNMFDYFNNFHDYKS